MVHALENGGESWEVSATWRVARRMVSAARQ